MKSPALKPRGVMRRRALALALVCVFAFSLLTPTALAAPHRITPPSPNPSQQVDWLSGESSGQLDPGIDVLIPADLPSPFELEPSIVAYDGYYQLYWMIPGGEPTFLVITGEYGGQIPDYSKADRNVQLEQNSDVLGHPAYRDLTDIYDLVYWQIGDVVYSVESRNLTDTDSLTLASSLIDLNPPETDIDSTNSAAISLPAEIGAGESIEIVVTGFIGADISSDAGYFLPSGESTIFGVSSDLVTWQAPDVAVATSVEFVLSDSVTGDWLASATTLVAPADQSQPLTLKCPEVVFGGESVEFQLSGNGYAVVDAGAGEFAGGEPNTLFAPDFAGGTTLVGVLSGSTDVTLIWNAPAVEQATLAYLFASNENGETPGECEIRIEAGSEVQAASLDAESANESDDSSAIGEESNPTETPHDPATEAAKESALLLQEDKKETSTPDNPTPRPTKTPKPYNEVIGIPTTQSEGQTAVAARATLVAGTTPTSRPTATFAPTLLDDGTVASVMGPEGGSLTSPQGVTIIVPEGALPELSTITIQPVADSKLPTGAGVQLVRKSAFDVTVAGANGRAIEELALPAEVRVQLDETLVKEGVRLYSVDGSTLLLLPNVVIEGDELVVPVTSFSRIVAGKPVPVTTTAKRNVLPFLIAAVVVVIGLVVMTVLAGMFRPRRRRIITNRRPTRTRHR